MRGMFDAQGEWDGARLPSPEGVFIAEGPREAILPALHPAHEVLWNGVFYGYSGYAKANREIMLRLANSFRVSITHAIDLPPPDVYSKIRVDLHTRVPVSNRAPLVRFFGPWSERDRHKERSIRILYTMMETECIHPTMVGLTNDNYDEVWVPTAWNAETFKKSGLTLPTRIMPLGVDPFIFNPTGPAWLPRCRLVTTNHATAEEVPEAEFTFIYVFLPSFRKAAGFLMDAFHDAFAGDPHTGLILCISHHRGSDEEIETLRPERGGPVWVLHGEYTEHDLAAFYRACNAYVCTSKGEGWNLPMCEAAACGLPVIAPRSSCHSDVAGADALLFDHEGWESIVGADKISPWYDNMAFPIYGKRSHEHLVEHLRATRRGTPEVRARAARFQNRLRTETTWDHAARKVAERLVEVQP